MEQALATIATAMEEDDFDILSEFEKHKYLRKKDKIFRQIISDGQYRQKQKEIIEQNSLFNQAGVEYLSNEYYFMVISKLEYSEKEKFEILKLECGFFHIHLMHKFYQCSYLLPFGF